jgi:DNA-binding MarR family transcriptional regulator
MTSTPPDLDLEHFLPYRLSVLANLVAGGLSKLYQDRFDLKLPEWRVMAVLGRQHSLTASEIADVTAMDKVAISRAVARMVDQGRIAARGDPHDKRRVLLSLTASGQAIYAEVVPLALATQAQLLGSLADADKHQLDALLARLTDAARAL